MSRDAPALSRRMRALRAPICYAAAVLAGDWRHALASCRRWCSSNKCRPRWRFISPAAGVSISVALNGLGMWGQPNHSSLCLYLLRRKPGRIFDYFICLCSTVRLWLIFFWSRLLLAPQWLWSIFQTLKLLFCRIVAAQTND